MPACSTSLMPQAAGVRCSKSACRRCGRPSSAQRATWAAQKYKVRRVLWRLLSAQRYRASFSHAGLRAILQHLQRGVALVSALARHATLQPQKVFRGATSSSGMLFCQPGCSACTEWHLSFRFQTKTQCALFMGGGTGVGVSELMWMLGCGSPRLAVQPLPALHHMPAAGPWTEAACCCCSGGAD